MANKERPPSPPKQEKTAASTSSKDKGKGGAKGKDKGKDKDQKGSRPSSQQFDHSKPHWSLRIASDASAAVRHLPSLNQGWSLSLITADCNTNFLLFPGWYWSEERHRESGWDSGAKAGLGERRGGAGRKGRSWGAAGCDHCLVTDCNENILYIGLFLPFYTFKLFHPSSIIPNVVVFPFKNVKKKFYPV